MPYGKQSWAQRKKNHLRVQGGLTTPLSGKDGSPLSLNQLQETYDCVDFIIENLDAPAIEELMGGYESDVDGMLSILIEEAAAVIASDHRTLNTGSFGYLDKFSESVEETLRCRSFNYFKLTVLHDFILGWHNIEWGNLVQMFRMLGILAARDHGKCVSPDTEVVMFDGSLKRASKIQTGDLLMGIGSSPRKVLKTYRGTDQMYKIQQTNNGGDDYVVNSRHLLHLEQDEVKWSKTHYKKTGKKERVNITPKGYLDLNKTQKNNTFGVRVNGWELFEKKLPIDPYFLGTWLGDGEARGQMFSSIDSVLIDVWKEVLQRMDCKFYQQKNSNCDWSIRAGEKGNTWAQLLKSNNLHTNKHIPEIYFQSSREQRLSLLAGLIDTDGNYEKKNNRFTFAFKKDTLAKDVQRLALSLGFKSRVRYQKVYLNYSDNKEYIREEVIVTGDIWHIPTRLSRKQATERVRNHDVYRHRIDVESVGLGDYCGFTVNEDNLFILKDGTITHNSYEFSFAYPLWQLYRFKKKTPLGNLAPKELRMAREGLLVTNEYGLARHLLGILKEEVEHNEVLSKRLLPDSKRNGWGSERIVTKNGASMTIKSAQSKIRGYHPTWIVLDDFLNESSLYSQAQRDKYWNVFSGILIPALSPGGQMVVVGTPFFEKDLYGILREKNLFPVFEYPAIYPDGRLLFPERHTFESIMEKKELLGSLIFSRELLVTPISDAAAIFPYDILLNAIRGQDKICLSHNRESCHQVFDKIVVGCDFAISSTVGADFSVFTVCGVDEIGRIHVLNCWRKSGASFRQQIGALKKINRDFRPDLFVVETNGMQEIFLQMLEEVGLPVIGKHTGNDKKSLYKGVPALAILFETNLIKFPYGDQKAKDFTDLYFAELNSITFIQDKGKLESVSQHDDTSLSLWQAVRGAKNNIDDFDFSWLA